MRVGTRGSALALAQASTVAALLGPDAELVPITTSGDRDSGRAQIDKERWVKELELALLAGEIDLAVHSAKDVPSELPEGLKLAGAPLREDPFDALVGAYAVAELPEGARVGTASVRRAAQLRSLRDDLEIVSVRGNVDTRLRLLESRELDALVLAGAGLRRLDREEAIGCVLSDLVPAPGQGTLALEMRVADDAALAAIRAISDAPTWDALQAERALVARLQASCNTPLGALATVDEAGVVVETWVGLPDGSAWVHDTTAPAASPEQAGALAAERVLAAGGGDLLRRAEELAE